MRTERDAFEEGAKAAAMGIPKEDNPYEADVAPDDRAAWDEGWSSIDPDDGE